MRNKICLNKDWLFIKNTTDITARDGESVDLPHTWNAVDGQDGGNDYFRGSCLYVKRLKKAELPSADRYYLEICGANSSADVYAGGEKLCTVGPVQPIHSPAVGRGGVQLGRFGNGRGGGAATAAGGAGSAGTAAGAAAYNDNVHKNNLPL